MEETTQRFERVAEPNAHFTQTIATYASALEFHELPDDVVEIAGQCVLDWTGVTLAGSREPAARIALAVAIEDRVPDVGVTVVGTDVLLPPSDAALVNGTASHALDFDDANTAMTGHPSVPVLGSLLALGESRGESGRAIVTAFVAGYETECRVARAIGGGHYRLGFHATGTIGTIGAAVACARLLGLGPEETATAIGLAATQAAALKAMFGTMAKPLHAGKAATNGLLAARLAARGFSANSAAIEAKQGMADTMGGSFDGARGLRNLGHRWFVRGNLFKYHAACYETHETIEGIRELHAQAPFAIDDVERVVVHANPLQLGMCAIADPTTGLEAKFSLRHVAALAIMGFDTSAVETFTDARAHDPDVVAVRSRVEVAQDGPDAGGTPVDVYLRDGRGLHAAYDAHKPATDLNRQRKRLEEKARTLAAPIVGPARAAELIALLGEVDALPDIRPLLSLTRTGRRGGRATTVTTGGTQE